MFCSECGKQLADDAKFCGECGAAQSNEEQSLQQVSQKASVEIKNTNYFSANYLLAYFIVSAILALIFYALSDKSEVEANVADTTQLEQGNNVGDISAEEKAKLAEAERMRAASVERERTVGKMEREQLRQEADAYNRKQIAQAEDQNKMAQAKELQQNKIRYTTIFSCVDQYNPAPFYAGLNRSLADMLIRELSNPNGVYAAYMNISTVSEYCSSLGTPFYNLELLHQKGQLISSENGRELYIVDLAPNITVGVVGR